jgi:phospholipase/lecithinase/hemolysin
MMKKSLRLYGACLAAASLMIGCGGGDDGNDYSRAVNFGDSLSDAGTYRVTEVAARGGGRFTVNGSGVLLWTDLLAREIDVPAPCPAERGLNSDPASPPFLTPVMPPVVQPACYNYAQGGSRVTELVGPNNRALQALGDPNGALGHLTVPVAAQVSRHLAKGNGRFRDDELVTVLAGGNDLFVNLALVQGGTSNANAAIGAMATAGAQLATLVKDQMVAKGARRVVLVNLPDVSLTPVGLDAEDDAPGLIRAMSAAFNEALQEGVEGEDEVLLVDAFTRSQAQAAKPADFQLDNATDAVCTSSLGSWNCTAQTLIPAATSRYLYADGVHPTPYGHLLLADLVLTVMANRGWL